ncbi:hypothetical protein ACHAXH_009219 [Discostella pseudostelligera]|jgi:hypothetical protein
MMSDRQARLAALAAKAGRLPQQSMVHPKDNENSNDDNVADRGNNDNDNDGKSSTNKPTLSFRNYVPKDASLDAPPPIDDASNNNGDKQLVSNKRQKTSTITKINKESSSSSSTTTAATPPKSALEIALAKTNREARLAAGQSVGGGTGLDESSGVSAGGGWNAVVTPSASTKKVNWDLKRDVQHKMDKLEKRTQRAIVQLLRERLEREAAVGDDDDDEVGDID